MIATLPMGPLGRVLLKELSPLGNNSNLKILIKNDNPCKFQLFLKNLWDFLFGLQKQTRFVNQMKIRDYKIDSQPS